MIIIVHIIRLFTKIFHHIVCIVSIISFYILLLCSSLAVGTKSGYRLFSLSSVDNLEQIYENGECEGYEMLQCFSMSRPVSVR
jgi:hypothetical protein